MLHFCCIFVTTLPFIPPNQTGETQSRQNRIELLSSSFLGHYLCITCHLPSFCLVILDFSPTVYLISSLHHSAKRFIPSFKKCLVAFKNSCCDGLTVWQYPYIFLYIKDLSYIPAFIKPSYRHLLNSDIASFYLIFAFPLSS